MKHLPIIVWVFIIGCATGGGPQLSADKLSLIKPGETTRQQMIQWFGEPISVGMDASGKASATWYHARVVAAPFYSDLKTQMLVAIFETNNLLMNFTLSDQIKSTNAPAGPPKGTKGANQ